MAETPGRGTPVRPVPVVVHLDPAARSIRPAPGTVVPPPFLRCRPMVQLDPGRGPLGRHRGRPAPAARRSAMVHLDPAARSNRTRPVDGAPIGWRRGQGWTAAGPRARRPATGTPPAPIRHPRASRRHTGRDEGGEVPIRPCSTSSCRPRAPRAASRGGRRAPRASTRWTPSRRRACGRVPGPARTGGALRGVPGPRRGRTAGARLRRPGPGPRHGAQGRPPPRARRRSPTSSPPPSRRRPRGRCWCRCRSGRGAPGSGGSTRAS